MRSKSLVLISLVVIFQTSVLGQDTYPKITGYASVLHPIITINKDHGVTNFDGFYQVVFPFGINIWKSPKIGFSMELAPGIRAEGGNSKMNSLPIHPGVLVALGKGFGFAGRAAFETSGRYGFTPVLSKTVIKKKTHGYYIATPFPVRFGNDQPASFTAGLQAGISF